MAANVLKKKPIVTNYSHHCTTNLIAHAAKIVMRTFRRRMEEKTEDFLGEDQFGFGPRERTRDALGC
jgi:hypothetical protein